MFYLQSKYLQIIFLSGFYFNIATEIMRVYL